jgi:S1-C subfamily serine protease
VPGKRPFLGISAGDLTDEERKSLGIGGGIRIADVQGPAAKAGLRAGDILLSIGDDPVTEETIVRLLERRRPGDTVDVTVLRGRKKESLRLTLGERAD